MGRKLSEEHKTKLHKAWKGKHHSEKAKIKISQIHLGKKLSIEHRRKLSLKKKELLKNPGNHPNWKGGITTYNRKLYLNGRRRVLKLNATGNHTFGEWENLKAQYNWTCPSCGKSEPEIKLTEDHIIPLTKGGSDNIENIQPLCRSCNSKKYNKIIKY